MNSIQSRPRFTLVQISLVVGILVALSHLEPALAQSRRRTTTGNQGGSLTTERQVNRQGDGNYTRSGSYTGTGPGGRSRSGTFSGSGSRSWSQGEGLNNSSTTDVTTSRGNTYTVDRNTNTTFVEGEGLQQTRNTTLTDGSGEVLGTSSGRATLNSSGADSSTTVTGRQGRSRVVDSSLTPQSQGQFRRSTTVSTQEGAVLGGAETLIEVEGERGQGWTKRVTGTTTSGRVIDRTTTNEPIDTEDESEDL